jgi:hypothetical protein
VITFQSEDSGFQLRIPARSLDGKDGTDFKQRGPTNRPALHLPIDIRSDTKLILGHGAGQHGSDCQELGNQNQHISSRVRDTLRTTRPESDAREFTTETRLRLRARLQMAAGLRPRGEAAAAATHSFATNFRRAVVDMLVRRADDTDCHPQPNVDFCEKPGASSKTTTWIIVGVVM